MKNFRTLVAYGIFFFAVICAARLLPHPANVAPVAAIAMIASAYLSPRFGVAVAFAAMFASDLVLGWYEAPIMVTVYGSFLISALLGIWVRRERVAGRVIVASLAGSIAFFALTNFAVWLWSGMYTHDAAGLLACYVAAVPFFRNTLIGDLGYSLALFAVFEALTRWQLARETSAITS